MTACGFSKKENGAGSLTCQIQSVNRKHLDLSLQLPDCLFAKEADLRLMIAEKVQRGHLHLRFQFFPKEEIEVETRLHLAMAKSLQKELASLSSHLDLKTPPELLFSLLATQKGFLTSELKASSTDLLYKLLDEVVQDALLDLDKMKRKEGSHLQEDMELRILAIQTHFSTIEGESKSLPQKIGVRLREQLSSLIPQMASEERVAQEIALLVQKADVTEELVRFRLHLAAFLDTLKSGAGGGKKLEFLLQELSREINTLSAKTSGSLIPPLAIEIKYELEKLREQVQNVE